MKGGGVFVLYVAIRQGTVVLGLLISEDKSLLIRGDTLLILNLRLDDDSTLRVIVLPLTVSYYERSNQVDCYFIASFTQSTREVQAPK